MVTGLGVLAFVGFVLYDLNQITADKPWKRGFFAAGFVWLALCTLWMSKYDRHQFEINTGLRVFFAIFCGISVALLIHALFFAIPSDGMYLKKTEQRTVYDKGVYALCRHPGVLWLFAGYEFYGAFLGSWTLMLSGAVYSVCNVLYVMFLERYVFPKIFVNYEVYRTTTPFLIPNRASIKRCLQTILKDGSDVRAV